MTQGAEITVRVTAEHAQRAAEAASEAGYQLGNAATVMGCLQRGIVDGRFEDRELQAVLELCGHGLARMADIHGEVLDYHGGILRRAMEDPAKTKEPRHADQS